MESFSIPVYAEDSATPEDATYGAVKGIDDSDLQLAPGRARRATYIQTMAHVKSSGFV